MVADKNLDSENETDTEYSNVINEDLQTRLPRISECLYNEVKAIQLQNSRNNLHLGSNMSVEGQQRDENGKFTK